MSVTVDLNRLGRARNDTRQRDFGGNPVMGSEDIGDRREYPTEIEQILQRRR